MKFIVDGTLNKFLKHYFFALKWKPLCLRNAENSSMAIALVRLR